MSEFIYKRERIADGIYSAESTGEQIVRCRDCAYRRDGWNGKRPTFSDWFFCAYWGGHELTSLDGYCAWGERKEGGE